MSRSVTVGRNSQFFTLTEEDRDILGGVEYRSLKLLLKIVSGIRFITRLASRSLPSKLTHRSLFLRGSRFGRYLPRPVDTQCPA